VLLSEGLSVFDIRGKGSKVLYIQRGRGVKRPFRIRNQK
jgi:hypothetical protein